MNQITLKIIWTLFWMHHSSGMFFVPDNLIEPVNPWVNQAANPSWLELHQQNFPGRDETALRPSPTLKQTHVIEGNFVHAKSASIAALNPKPDEGMRRSKRVSGERTLTLKRVVQALEKLTKFLVRHAEEANFDALMSIRMVQGHFKQVLDALSQSEGSDWLSQTGINDWMQQTVTGLYVRLDTAAKTIGRRGTYTNREYFAKFHPLVMVRFWQAWALTPPITAPPPTPTAMPQEEGQLEEARERILRGKEQIVEHESDECMGELLQVPTLSNDYYERQAGLGNSPRGSEDEKRLLELIGTQMTFENDDEQIDVIVGNEFAPETTKDDDAGGAVKETCMISPMCWGKMTAPGSGGYSLTHQLLYLIIGRLAGCEDQLEAMASISPQSASNVNVDLYNLQDIDLTTNDDEELSKSLRKDLRADARGHLRVSPVKQSSVLDELIRDQCSTILWEAGILADAGFPEHRRDLFMEQGFLCGLALFSPEYFTKEWIEQVLQWQKPNGCYGLGEDVIKRSTLQTGDGVFLGKTREPSNFPRKNRVRGARFTSLTMKRKHATRESPDGEYLIHLETTRNKMKTQMNWSQDVFQTRRPTLHNNFNKLDRLEEEFLKNIRRNRGEKLELRESESKQVGLKKHRRSKRSEQIMSDQCQAHRSAVALGYLAMALRYLYLGD